MMVGQDDGAYVQDDTGLGDDHSVEDLDQHILLILPGCNTNRLDEFGGAIPALGLGIGCLTLR